MTWVSHSIVTFATLFVATHNVFIAGCATLGSAFPDQIEDAFWKSNHRSYSHWFVLYVAALAFFWTPDMLSVTGVKVWQMGMIEMMRRFLFWFFAGALLHILEDAVCGPVPLWRPTKRTTVLPRLFKVKSVGEVLFVIGYCAIMYLVEIV
ncbi:MAG: hypothetical protein IJ056_04130 [Acidaminococcaceae bacterium]|nr:hypothetical protein [Acidaminococcaceae bacterium]